jgi:hypothetical protein
MPKYQEYLTFLFQRGMNGIRHGSYGVGLKSGIEFRKG